MPAKSRGICSAVIAGSPAAAGWPSVCKALLSAVRMSRPIGIVTGHGFVGALEDDDVLLAGQCLDNRRFRERANDVEVDGADLRASRCSRR